MFADRRVLVTGGTGSLGRTLVRRLLAAGERAPARVTVFSRDEDKQHRMRLAFAGEPADVRDRLHFRLGDVADFDSLMPVVREADLIFHVAALKQVPACEYFPAQAIRTNIRGTENLVRAVADPAARVETVIGVSTDKAVKPVNVMGMTKAVQERLLIQANLEVAKTRFIAVRYGNVLASRGSVIPLFHRQIRAGGPVTVTTSEMTRFLLSLGRAVETVFAALAGARRGEVWVPELPAARVVDLARALIGDRPVAIETTGIRPGEKIHEILISEEELPRTVRRDGYLVLQPALPELRTGPVELPALDREFSSREVVLDLSGVAALLAENGLLASRGAEPEERLG